MVWGIPGHGIEGGCNEKRKSKRKGNCSAEKIATPMRGGVFPGK